VITSAENGAPATERRLIPLDKMLAEYVAGLRLVWPKESEQRTSVEASEMQAYFIFFPEDGGECISESSERN
jgi:hypothetical protein